MKKKNELQICRKKLDKIDSKIICLFEKRMNVIKRVAEYKITNKLDSYDPKREQSMIDKNCGKLKNKDYENYYKEVLQSYLLVSKEYQNEIKSKK